MEKRFKDFIFEKVNKQEINQILNDEYILVGGEFEFFCDAAANNVGGGADFEELHDSWETFIRDVREWQEEVEGGEQEVQMEIENLENQKENIEEEISNYEDYVEREKEKEDADPDHIEEIENELESMQDKLRDLENEIEEKEDERQDVINTVNLPIVPTDLIDYAEMIGFNMDLRNFDWIELLENPNEVLSDLRMLEPDNEGWVDEDSVLEETKDLLERETSIDVDVGSFSPDVGDTEWTLTTDSSVDVSEGGVELISPPLPMPEFIEKCEDIFYFIDSFGHTDSRTGFHVHMSIDGVNLKRDLDVVKLFLFHDEEYTYKFFRERKGNHMAMSIKDKMKEPDFNFGDLEKIMKVDKLEKNLSTSKFYGINLSYIEGNHIEYRYMGGTGYEQKFENTKSTIANYAFNLKLACDPQFKRQEYVKKLSRMIDKKVESDKPTIFAVALCDYVQNTIQDKLGTTIGTRELIEKLQEIKIGLNDLIGGMPIQDVIRSYKAMNYDKKEVMRGIEIVARDVNVMELASEHRDIKDYWKDLYSKPQKLLKSMKKRYKDIKPITKIFK